MLFSLDAEAARRFWKRLERQGRGWAWEGRHYDEIGAPPPWPSHKAFVTLLEGSFWASLSKEEGAELRFSLRYAGPWNSPYILPDGPWTQSLLFRSELPFSVGTLAKLAPTAEATRYSVLVHEAEDESLSICGLGRREYDWFLGAVVLDPGVLIVQPGGFRMPTTVLRNDRWERISRRPVEWDLWSSPLVQAHWHTLLDVAFAMREGRHGGCILLLPDHPSPNSLQSIYEPIVPNASLIRERYVSAEDSSPREAASIARLAAIDGAVALTEDFRVLCFGAKIRALEEPPRVLLQVEPMAGDKPRETPLGEFGGMRHQSAAQFVSDNKNAVAVVVSEDGPVTVLSWDSARSCVCALRNAHYLQFEDKW